MQDEAIGWLILVCGSFDAPIAPLVRSPETGKGLRSLRLMTVVLGVVIFVDDYLISIRP